MAKTKKIDTVKVSVSTTKEVVEMVKVVKKIHPTVQKTVVLPTRTWGYPCSSKNIGGVEITPLKNGFKKAIESGELTRTKISYLIGHHKNRDIDAILERNPFVGITPKTAIKLKKVLDAPENWSKSLAQIETERKFYK